MSLYLYCLRIIAVSKCEETIDLAHVVFHSLPFPSPFPSPSPSPSPFPSLFPSPSPFPSPFPLCLPATYHLHCTYNLLVSLHPPGGEGSAERRGGINAAVATDVNAIFKGKTVSTFTISRVHQFTVRHFVPLLCCTCM